VKALAAVVLLLALPARAQEAEIAAAVDRDLPRALALLERAVRVSSATGDRAGVRRVGALFARELRALGFTTRWVPLPPRMKRAGHLVAERRGARGKRILLIGHLDTVLPGGRWRVEGGVARGSGVVDMKGGDVVALAALRALHRAGVLDGAQIIVVFTGDEEEPGRPTEESRAALVEAARRSDVALAFEPAIRNTATVARRGTSVWKLEVRAATGHSSGIFGDALGSGAIFEAARILSRFHDELREPYLTYSPGLILGGSQLEHDAPRSRGTAGGKTNVVADRAVVTGDLRFLSAEQRERAKARMREIAAASLPGASAGVTFSDGYPPMQPTDANRALVELLDEVSRDLGFGPVEALDPGARGAGDVSFVAPHVAGLDGLGAAGGRSHTAEEHLDLDSLPRQIKRAAVLIHRLSR
jgi:glutamate carboxypeptidase